MFQEVQKAMHIPTDDVGASNLAPADTESAPAGDEDLGRVVIPLTEYRRGAQRTHVITGPPPRSSTGHTQQEYRLHSIRSGKP